MTGRRWDPIQREWVITATHRQERTFKPLEDYCPFCPTEDDDPYPTAIPQSEYDMTVIENGFPSLQTDPPDPAISGSDLLVVDKAKGKCEVVLFTQDHNGVMSDKPVSKFIKMVKVWQDRYTELGAVPDHEYVHIFENKGEEVGVTLEHPHGQIYAYPFVPPIIRKELTSSEEHYKETGDCLYCRYIDEEIEDGQRVVMENDSFIAVVPFHARWTYEVHIYAKDHLASLSDFAEKHERDLGRILKDILVRYDGLYNFEMPYVMSIHQQPTNGEASEYAHFHIEFYPPYRTEDKLKYPAGSERGVGTYINNKLPEEAANALRDGVSD